MKKRRKKNIWKILLVVFLAFVVYAAIIPLFQSDWRVVAESRKLPKEFNNTTIVFLSDIHCGPYYSPARLTQLVRHVNSFSPDIVILGGDYVHRLTANISQCMAPFSLISAPYRFAVLGNHEHWSNTSLIMQSLNQSGFVVLDDSSSHIEGQNSHILISGAADYWTDFQQQPEILKKANASDYTILVSHNPEYFEYLPLEKTDLALAGHTHAGQFFPFLRIASLLPKNKNHPYRYISGERFINSTHIIISTGVGEVSLPLRLLPSQLIVIRLVSKNVSGK